jgi:hypothetical protein
MQNKYIGKDWYNEGTFHRVENGQIARDFIQTRWVVLFQTAEEFETFCKKYEQVVISIDNSGLTPCYSVEIYDTYRE